MPEATLQTKHLGSLQPPMSRASGARRLEPHSAEMPSHRRLIQRLGAIVCKVVGCTDCRHLQLSVLEFLEPEVPDIKMPEFPQTLSVGDSSGLSPIAEDLYLHFNSLVG